MGKTRNTGNISAENIISVDISNDRVGINSTSPTSTLDVGGTINATSVNVSGVTTITSNASLDNPALDIRANTSLNSNTLRFTDTDATSTTNQSIGKIEFYSSDTSSAGVVAQIACYSRDLSPEGYLTFSTELGSTLSERMRINYDGNIGINNTIPGYTLDVSGDINFSGTLYQAGVEFTSGGGGGGGSGTFDTGITTSIYVSVTSGIATGIGGVGISTADSQLQRNNDIFIGPGIAYSFPSTAGKKYVIESIHISNTFSNELYFVGRHDFNGGSNVPLAQRVIVPYQGATQFLDQPIIANPSDILRFQALSGVGTTATGIDGGLDAFIIYSEKDDTNYVGTGKTVTTAAGTEIFQATTNPAMLQSIKLCNYSLNTDIDASISIYRGSLASGVRLGYLAYNLTIPKNSVIEILEKPAYLAASDSIVGGASTANVLGVTLSGKYIV